MGVYLSFTIPQILKLEGVFLYGYFAMSYFQALYNKEY